MHSRILIADDHAGVRKMLKLIVETQTGWEVCGEAENGQEAVDMASDLRPNLIIMDLAMPVMDGIRASRAISTAMPAVPILMHTLHYSAELELEAKKVGVRRVLAKAEGGDALIGAISALLDENAGMITALKAPEVSVPLVDPPAAEAPQNGTESSAAVDGLEDDTSKPN
jgi:DNA-binding NarL/FixJ family response regulator